MANPGFSAEQCCTCYALLKEKPSVVFLATGRACCAGCVVICDDCETEPFPGVDRRDFGITRCEMCRVCTQCMDDLPEAIKTLVTEDGSRRCEMCTDVCSVCSDRPVVPDEKFDEHYERAHGCCDECGEVVSLKSLCECQNGSACRACHTRLAHSCGVYGNRFHSPSTHDIGNKKACICGRNLYRCAHKVIPDDTSRK